MSDAQKRSNPHEKTVSIIVPLFNEEASIHHFYSRLSMALDNIPYPVEIIFINDGSKDETINILEEIITADSRVRVIQLSRNFGHQAAITAGIDAAQGDYIVMLDGDGQHPPEMIAEMVHLADSGYDIVLTQRHHEAGQTRFKRASSSLFYRFINWIGDTDTLPGGADFRLITAQVREKLINMKEYHRFLRGMISWLGFNTVILPFTPEKRIAGKSKYTIKKMVRLASDAIFSFSLVPLYIGLSAGAFFLILAIIEAIYVLSFWISGHPEQLEPGWSSLMFMLLIIASILMIILGFIGVYVGYIFQEVKGRPVYVVQKTIGNPPNRPEKETI